MGFREHLEAVVSAVDGSVFCSVMGFDGISVDTHQPDARAEDVAALDLNAALVEYGNLLGQLKNAAQGLKTGAVSEMSVNSEKLLTIMRMVNQDYYVVLALLPEGNYGKGRYALRLAAPKLAKEL
jgi:predicted regulator of Ras-like GTPase activity (Roadblock/LC7/MglB family)